MLSNDVALTPIKKRKNTATSERMKKRKTQQASVVVQGIQTVLKEFPMFVTRIQTVVNHISQLAVLGSWALNHHILYCMHHQLSVPEINQAFCYSALAFCCKNNAVRKPYSDLRASFSQFKLLFPSNFQWPNNANISREMNYLARQFCWAIPL